MKSFEEDVRKTLLILNPSGIFEKEISIDKRISSKQRDAYRMTDKRQLIRNFELVSDLLALPAAQTEVKQVGHTTDQGTNDHGPPDSGDV